MDGIIHSVESFGSVDGPGIRFVIFCQGCPLRCRYCHNPDTWKFDGGQKVSCKELLAQYHKNKVFYKNGGITVTGGEALMQIDFLLELFSMAKQEGIHTCIDTSGVTYREGNSEYLSKLDALLQLTDLVLLDLKQIDPQKHKDLTGVDNQGILAFSRYLEKKHMPIWIRHVLIPGLTDNAEDLHALGAFIGGLSNVKAVEVLPYHTMGVNKYRELGIPYTLENTRAADKSDVDAAKKIILQGIRETRQRLQ